LVSFPRLRAYWSTSPALLLVTCSLISFIRSSLRLFVVVDEYASIVVLSIFSRNLSIRGWYIFVVSVDFLLNLDGLLLAYFALFISTHEGAMNDENHCRGERSPECRAAENRHNLALFFGWQQAVFLSFASKAGLSSGTAASSPMSALASGRLLPLAVSSVG